MKTLLLLFISLAGTAQKIYLDQTPKAVEDYLLTQPGYLGNVHVQKDDKGAVYEIYVMIGNSGLPTFVAQFENNKCVVFCSVTSDSKVSKIKDAWKSNGYVYDKANDRWVNKAKKAAFYCEDLAGDSYQMCCQRP